MILIKCFDSDGTKAKLTAHTAFEDPTTPANAAPRQSIESRTFVFIECKWPGKLSNVLRDALFEGSSG